MLTPEEVRHVAMLARLGLSEEEVEAFRGQLVDVLDYIAMLQKVDTSAVPPTAQVLAQSDVMRPDVPRPGLSVEQVMMNAPAAEEGFVRVPAVLEETRGEGEQIPGQEVSAQAEEGTGNG